MAERRRAVQQERRAAEIRANPILGRLRHLVSPEADSGSSWAKGALGERRLGETLDHLEDLGALTLHDRRFPTSKANIDHLVVSSNGVWVIDAKFYKGAVAMVDKRDWSRSDVRLIVAGRDRTKLVHGVHKQVMHVELALSPIFGQSLAVRGVLCFIDADWAIFSKPFIVDRVLVTWGRALRARILEPGPVPLEQRAAIRRALATSFPPAV